MNTTAVGNGQSECDRTMCGLCRDCRRGCVGGGDNSDRNRPKANNSKLQNDWRSLNRPFNLLVALTTSVESQVEEKSMEEVCFFSSFTFLESETP